MAMITAEIKLNSIARTMTVYLYFPTDLPVVIGNEVKGVITLLHGFSNTAADWFYMSAAPRYAADNGYILVAPSVDNSFYSDMKYGPDFYTAMNNELSEQLHTIFNIPQEKEKNFICGLSMGGYGAFKTAFLNPNKYAAAGSFSGVLDMKTSLDENRQGTDFFKTFASVFGEELILPQNSDLFFLADKISKLSEKERPRIFATCGKQDNNPPIKILQQNRDFFENAKKLKLDYTYNEWNGVHEWSFWDRSLTEFISFIQNSDYAARKKNDWNTN